MAFVIKTWKDRIVQYANRRLLTKSGGEVEQVTVTRDEGTISEAGDRFDAATMNDLEQRVKDAFDDVNTALSGKADTGDLATVATSGKYSDLSNTPVQLKNNILQGRLLNYFNAASMVVDLDVAATNDRTWQAIIFNSNQAFMFICNFGTVLSKTRLTGTADLSLSYSNDNKRVTITPTSTAWGVTTILLVYFDRL